ncbi:MAG: hypothetical protein IKG18_02295 [Atopobiaceae bacterium]|nr:hypothetical protein [Atopobiaceae bacterium]
MIEDYTAEELERMFDDGEDPDELYDWDDAELAPPMFVEAGRRMPVVIHVDMDLLAKLDRMAGANRQSRVEYLSDMVENLLVTA